MHTIRLRKPWQRRTGNQSCRVDVPEVTPDAVARDANVAHPGADQESAAVVYRRTFNLPTGLASGDRVDLCVSGWKGRLESVVINGQGLTTGLPPLSLDITPHLSPHNWVELTLHGHGASDPCLDGEVNLVIVPA